MWVVVSSRSTLLLNLWSSGCDLLQTSLLPGQPLGLYHRWGTVAGRGWAWQGFLSHS